MKRYAIDDIPKRDLWPWGALAAQLRALPDGKALRIPKAMTANVYNMLGRHGLKVSVGKCAADHALVLVWERRANARNGGSDK